MASTVLGAPAPAVADTPNPVTCEGYPEKRRFVDSQSWWLPTEGATPAGTDHGHIHVGACIPERETMTGPFRLDIRMVLHDPGLQKINTGSTATPYVSVVMKDSSIEQTQSKLYQAGWTCSTPGTCTRWGQVTVDPSIFTTDGLKETRLRFFSDVKDLAANGTTSTARMTASLNFQYYVDLSPTRTVKDVSRDPYLRGKGWYSAPGNDLAVGGYCEADLMTVPLPDTPISGIWSPAVKMVWHGDAGDPPVTAHEVRIDPDFHNNIPGTIIRQASGEYDAPVGIDTTRLTNGRHTLFLRAECNDQYGRNSTASGVLIVPFDVDNGAGAGADTTAPSTPAHLASTSHTTTTVALAWDAATDNVGVAGYRVYRNGTQIADQPGRTYTDSGLSPATAYTYTVRAYDAATNLSNPSTSLTVTTDGAADTTAPTAPGGLVSSGKTTTTVALAWDAATDNVGVTGCRVYRNGTQIADQPGRTYTDSGLSPATAYTYTVRAYDAATNLSNPSTSLTVTTDGAADTTAPTAPGGLVSSGKTTTTVALAWDASTDNVGVAGYRVYRNGTQIADQPGRTYTDSGLSPATAYTYTVRAYDAATNLSNPSTSLTVTTNAQTGGIQRQGMSTVVNTTSTTSHTITKPASAAAGQVCVASLALNGSTVSAAPTGWTQFAGITSISNPHLYGYYHVMGASEPASYTWTTAGSVASGGGISCYSGVNTTTPLDTAASVAASATAATTGSVSGVTTTTAGAMLVGAIAINSSNTTIAIAAPSDMAEVYDLGGKRTELDDGLQAAAGSSGSKSWVWSSGSAREWAGWLVALRAQ
ncbi:fibronectin type III domain-containing protein [Arthrobacter sp. HS15c]|uniref:fibronectin type III domain-containing protein n=1 Tax=Arthrobacter sp. HS15c TaxID=3230279 RepID=UPI003467711F